MGPLASKASQVQRDHRPLRLPMSNKPSNVSGNLRVSPKEANHNVGTEVNIDAGDSEIDAESAQYYFVLPIWSSYTSTVKSSKAMNTEAEYVAAANCCGQVLWIQNQMLDYGFNFMNTKIYIDNESTICIVKNPVFHSKTKHIAIRHHFIRDAYEKKLIQVLKIHTDDNVADLLTKAFDVNSYLGFRESLERDIDGTEELLLPDLFILWLTKVSTDSAKLIPLGKDSTAIKTLEKIPPRV
ncbi:hypothetical protein Tco_0115808 [Tanacetum coccineum]